MRTNTAILIACLALPASTWTTSAALGQTSPGSNASSLIQPEVQARRLLAVEGNVTVSQAGGGFSKGVVGQLLQPGDRVMVGPNSLAQISYDGFCIERVRMDRIITVQRSAPCGQEGWQSVNGEPSIANLVASSPLAVGVGVAAVTGIAVGVANSGLFSGKPSSP